MKGRRLSIEQNRDTDTLKSHGLNKAPLGQYGAVRTSKVGFELYLLRCNQLEQIQGDSK